MELEEYYKAHGVNPHEQPAYLQARGNGNLIDFATADDWQRFYADEGLALYRPPDPPPLPEPPRDEEDELAQLRKRISRLETQLREMARPHQEQRPPLRGVEPPKKQEGSKKFEGMKL